ncbi:MAG: M4 family metallopeptidase [Candidatus Hydrogenedentes bacterium]|nr:M4 family metallopeptidase [Candidatus Hydrogenedentota bacterium]
MRKTNVLTTFAVATFVFIQSVNALAAADEPSATDEPAARQAAIRAAIQNLLATVDVYAASEKPRLGKRADGTLEFFGAPPGAPARLDPALASAPPEEKALAFLNLHAAAFGIGHADTTFEVIRVKTREGNTSVRLGQSYSGLPVVCGQVAFLLNQDGVLAIEADIMTKERYQDRAPIPLQPVVSPSEAEEMAVCAVVDSLANGEASVAGVKGDGDVAVLSNATLVIYDPVVVGNAGNPHLAWRVIVGDANRQIPLYQIVSDAMAGELLKMVPLVYSALDREIWGDGIIRFEGEDPVNPDLYPGVNECYDILGYAYDYFYSNFGRDSVDDNGLTLIAEVRAVYDGACWGSICEDQPPGVIGCMEGQFPFNGIVLLEPDFVVDDVLGHEYGHGVDHFEEGVWFSGEPGAIDEHLADVWGELFDLENGYGEDSSGVRWRLGEELSGFQVHAVSCPGETYYSPPFRYMDDPPLMCSPDRMHHEYYFTTDEPSYLNDWGGVHSNNGVGNKLCYLLTDGDTFRDRYIYGMGITDVEDLYYYVVSHGLLTSAMSYTNLYNALGQAAIGLNMSTADRKNIEEACRAVEIRPTKSVAFRNSAGATLAQLTDGGDLILIGGDLLTNQTITPSPTTRELIIKTASGTILALLDTSTGDFRLKGKLYEEAVSPTPPAKCFVVKQDTTAVSFITSSNWTNATLEPTYPYTVPAGSLILTGHVVSVDEE